MKPFLQAIVIESSTGNRRRLEFNAGVNIITGAGSKGKSAVLRIVEYCLGSLHCKVPVGKVQDFAAWYYLELNARDTRVIIGRRAPHPSPSRSSADDEAYYDEGASAVLPERLVANTSSRAALRSLGKHLGLPAGTFQLGLDDTEMGRVEVPELLPLLLQTQGIIANSEMLFLGADRQSRQRLREIIEIALGIVSNDLLVLRAKAKNLMAEKRRLETGKREAEKNEHNEREKFKYLRQRAVSMGVLPMVAPASTVDLRAELEQIINNSPKVSAPVVQDGTALAKAEAESHQLRATLRRLSRELERIGRIRGEAGRTRSSLDTQFTRLWVVDVLDSPRDEELHCPLCDSIMNSDSDDLLKRMRASLDTDLLFVNALTPELEEAERELLARKQEAENELEQIDARLLALQQQQIAPSMTDETIQRQRLIGAVEDALRWTPRTRVWSLEADLIGLDLELAATNDAIRAKDPESVERETLKRLSDRMTALASNLKRIELLGGKLAFDKSFSTIERILGDRRDPLSAIGGAENHVMYHICAMLALHEEFLRCGSPVPPILILDQPSQAYFPSDIDERKTDMEAVRLIYTLLFQVADNYNELQIIALDHADFSKEDPRFKDAKKYDWHGSDGLILPE